MIHRFDLHVHSFFSKDAASSPEQLIAAAKARGLSGIAITDHDNCDVHEYLLEKGVTTEAGVSVDGLLVVPGVEVSTAEGHLLCIGATLPYLKGHQASEVCAAIHERGGIAIPAHPYDAWRAGIRAHVMDSLPIQTVEVFNAAVSSRKYNDHAMEYAKNRGLKMTASSDAHHASAVGVSATAYDLDELSVSSLLSAIASGGTIEPNYLTRSEAVKKHLGNWFRIFNPKPRR